MCVSCSRRKERELNPQGFLKLLDRLPTGPRRQSGCPSVLQSSSPARIRTWTVSLEARHDARFTIALSVGPVGLEPTTHGFQIMYSESAVAVVFNAQRRVAKSCFRFGRPYQQELSLIVDRPVHLAETLGPFTSRSPGIATLGPSCTPGMQLGNVVWVVKRPNEVVVETSCLSAHLSRVLM